MKHAKLPIVLCAAMTCALLTPMVYGQAKATDSAFRHYRGAVGSIADQETGRFMDALDAVLGRLGDAQRAAFAKNLVVELGLIGAQGDVSTKPMLPPEAIEEIRKILGRERVENVDAAVTGLLEGVTVATEPEPTIESANL